MASDNEYFDYDNSYDDLGSDKDIGMKVESDNDQGFSEEEPPKSTTNNQEKLVAEEEENHDAHSDLPPLKQSLSLTDDPRLLSYFKESEMSKLPSKKVSEENDVLDFLLGDSIPLNEILTNLENSILSLHDLSLVYLRIGKLFNHACQKLAKLLESKDVLNEKAKLEEICSFLDLFDRSMSAVRNTPFRNACKLPSHRLLVQIDRSLFNKLLKFLTSNLDQLPARSGRLFMNIVLFVCNTPDPYVTSVDKPADYIFSYIMDNLYDNPNKSFYKFLTIAFWISPPRLVSRYLEDVISSLKAVVESSLQTKTASSNQLEENKMVEELKNGAEDEEDETNYQILKFLLVAINHEKVRKKIIRENFHVNMYDLLRNSSKVFKVSTVKLAPRILRLITNLISNMLIDLSSRQLETFRDTLNHDLFLCVDEHETNFILETLVPIFSGASSRMTPLCIHLEDTIENSLAKLHSKGAMHSQEAQAPHQGEGLNSVILTSQEKDVFLENVQKLSLDSLVEKDGNLVNVGECDWHKIFRIDTSSSSYAADIKNIQDELQNNDGVLFMFECLLTDEVAKIGAFCAKKLVKGDPNEIKVFELTDKSSLISLSAQENFMFCYTQNHKVHYLPASPQTMNLNQNFYFKGNINTQANHKQKLFLEFSDSKIAIYYNGNAVINYLPGNPEGSKIVMNFRDMVSEEEKIGKRAPKTSYDPKELCFIQSLECWILNNSNAQHEDQQENQIAADLGVLSQEIFLEHFGYLRSEPITLVPKELTVEQILSVLFKDDDGNVTEQIECKIFPQQRIEPTYNAEKILEMYQGSQSNILDLYLASPEGYEWLRKRFHNEHADGKLYEKLAFLAYKEVRSDREILSSEKIQLILRKVAIITGKNNKEFLNDYMTLTNETEIFLKIDSFHKLLLETPAFFSALFQIMNSSINNDLKSYKMSCQFLHLESVLFHTLYKIFKLDFASNLFEKVNMVELIRLLLQKIAEMNKCMDSSFSMFSEVHGPAEGKIGDILATNQTQPYHGYQHNYYQQQQQQQTPDAHLQRMKKRQEELKLKKARVLEKNLCRKIFKYGLFCTRALFEWNLSTKLKQEAADKIKQFKLISSISKVIGSLDGESVKARGSNLLKQLTKLLKKWSSDMYLSEMFWELAAESENRKVELEYTFYNMLMNRKESAEYFIDSAKKEEAVSKEAKESNKELIKNMQFTIDTFQQIDSNLRRFFYIDVLEQATELSKYLSLPLSQAYNKILKEMCVDSTSMKSILGVYQHHYSGSISSNLSQTKTQRILKEISDLTNSLPVSETNAIFVRYDKMRMDVMKSLIFGSRFTPYAHGAFVFDLFVPDNYPNSPPLCNLETTGSGAVRFNPNLYHCGKVCLSLLGTWRGNASENWNPQLSTLLQVMISIQCLIMTEDVYFNEPGYEGSKKTKEGELLNEGYSNIVKYANIKYAMVENMKNPPHWFKDVILIHFYLKKDMILEDCMKWIEEARTTSGTYGGLVSCHNSRFCQMFAASPLAYHDHLVKAVKELKDCFANLNVQIDKSIRSRSIKWKRKPIMEIEEMKEVDIDSRVEPIDNIDVSYDQNIQQRAINIDDEKVTNRWSRYIGAMGIESVEKQANAQICLFGLNALGVEIAKNIVLSGVKRFTIIDGKRVDKGDLSGQFFLNEGDVGKNRAQACLNKLQALNQYVKIDFIELSLENCYVDLARFVVGYSVVVACEGSDYAQTVLNDYCRKAGSYFISAVSYGLFSRVFCDFGEKFTVLDRTGDEYQEMFIKSIANSDKGLVTLIDGTKHNLQDGDEILITQVVEENNQKLRSINETQHKVTVVDKSNFYIGDTQGFMKYIRGGVSKQLKQTATINFKTLYQISKSQEKLPPFDQTISFSDWDFVPRNYPLHIAFQKIDWFNKTYNRLPGVWSDEDANILLNEVAKELQEKYPEQWGQIQSQDSSKALFVRVTKTFAYTFQGVFPPLAAYIGGVAAQEAIKAITKKYMPINQFYYFECSEVVSDLTVSQMQSDIMGCKEDRDIALKKCIGESTLAKVASSKVFMVGSGAIGCELLKNYAMLSLGTSKEKGKEGRIYLTDPDVIENSNLNRQFLFREKHIRKPKSTTAAAVAVAMNTKLKGNIMPLVEKVYDQTEVLFSDTFFGKLDAVTNALDNVNARRYVDARCVKNRKPLLESGTLGPKGHVQVIIPFKTESYGSQQDPQEDNEIPYCTLKMFPEETLHCVEWARDKFNKMFTQKPRSFEKMIESANNYEDLLAQEHKILIESNRFLKNWPRDLSDCITWARNKFEKFFVNDIKQLLKVYPLDHKLENGNLFWMLPKRPPVEIAFDPNNETHSSFVTACAFLRAVTCGIALPPNPRSPEVKAVIALKASKVAVKKFIESDKKAQQLKKESENSKQANQGDYKIEEEISDKDSLAKSILSCIKERVGDLATAKKSLKCLPQEFEKDEDENFHIDVLYGMTNCRASNYKLEKMDWITVKLKAGRIIPALATTTSAIAALQTIELVKVLLAAKSDQQKNSFLNLSVPVLTQSEPSDAPAYVLTPRLKVNLWDRWDIDLKKHKEINNLQSLFKHLKDLTSLEPLDCLKGNTAVYILSLMNMPNKKKDKETLLYQPLQDTFGIAPNQKHLDLNVTFTSEEARLKNPKDITLKGVPPIRLLF